MSDYLIPGTTELKVRWSFLARVKQAVLSLLFIGPLFVSGFLLTTYPIIAIPVPLLYFFVFMTLEEDK